MSLLGSLQIASNSLFASQIGLQVVANNIANANTPGYVRQQVVLSPATTQAIGDITVGLGVTVEGIVQTADRFLSERLRGASSDLASSEAQEKSYLELEALIGELSETDLSSSLSDFFGSINDVLNQPESPSIRGLATLQGQSLTQDIARLDRRVRDVRSDVNSEIALFAPEVNGLLKEIADLNVEIVITEGGRTLNGDAGNLRDQRSIALGKLSEIVSITVAEQQSGAVSVFAGGDYLVFDGEHREVGVSIEGDRGLSANSINLVETDSPLAAASGKLAGLYGARDEILGGFLDKLQDFTESLMFEFNRVYSSGQGLSGFRELTSEFAVSDADAALDQASLPFTPVNGSFQVLVHNTQTGLSETNDLLVKLSGFDDDTTLNDLVSALNDIEGLTASITPDSRLQLESDSPDLEFGFENDTSGILAALGVNTFFSGTSARDISISTNLLDDPTKFAASRGGFGSDIDNAIDLASFANRPLDSQDGLSLSAAYDALIGEVAQSSSVTRAVTQGFRTFQQTLEGQHLGITGVSVDDEAIKMLGYQRTYQATARYISTINELLNTLVNL